MALSRITGLSRAEKRSLVDLFGSAATLFREADTLEKPVRGALKAFKGFADVEREIRKAEAMGARVITLGSEEYPVLLGQIPDAPLALFAKGTFPASPDRIAVVGSRKATFEGINIAERTAQTLSSLGITVVSGLARGIDAASHRGAVRERGKTIAVLGCGIDICYPSENRYLFDLIAQEGAVVTEYGLGVRPFRGNFPERNRIIAGLSKGVLIIEATARSGSLITARHGLDYGRDVLALPGRIFDDEYKGANRLIREGAKLVAGIDDILNTCFPCLEAPGEKVVAMDQRENYVYSMIGRDRVHVDELIVKSGLETREVMAILTRLELKDVVKPIPGGYYIRKV